MINRSGLCEDEFAWSDSGKPRNRVTIVRLPSEIRNGHFSTPEPAWPQLWQTGKSLPLLQTKHGSLWQFTGYLM